MTYYFAYGMNTNIDSMSQRCPNARAIGVGYIKDYKMVFKYHADMIQFNGHIAPGVLWQISNECLQSLDAFEGFPDYYLRKFVTVTTENGDTIEALMYYMTEGAQLSDPSNSYYDMVLQGYDTHGISEQYLINALPESVV